MSTLQPAYRFADLSAGYGKTEILSSLGGSLLRGTVTVLVGPNGGGKSTLLKTLGGFLPYRGSLRLNGRELRSYSRRELGKAVGAVAQQRGLKTAFSVREVIGFGLLPHRPLLSRPSRADARAVLDAASRVDVSHLLFRPVTELSGGERQRVLLAMLLVQDPAVFLLDEPTSAMDPRQAVFSYELMRELAGRGKTVVAAAHDVNAAMRYADFYIALRGGRIVSAGRADGIDGEVLGALYGAPFIPYTSSGGDRVWFPA